MNRRQAKKKYKKRYGHNPPIVTQPLYELKRIGHETAEAIANVNDALDAMTYSIQRMIEQHKKKVIPDTQVEVAVILAKKRKKGYRKKRGRRILW